MAEPEDIFAAIEQMENLSQELKGKLEEIFAATGQSPEEMKIFLDNPENFTPTQWEVLQENRQALDALVKRALGKTGEKRGQTRAAKKRKKKTLGRRKGWLSMD